MNIAGALIVLSATYYNVRYPRKMYALIQKRNMCVRFSKLLHDTLQEIKDFMLSLHNTGMTSLIPLVLLFYSPIVAKINDFFCI